VLPTDDSVIHKASGAIAVLDRPWAISRRTYCSRGDSEASGDPASRARRATSLSTTRWSMTEPPPATAQGIEQPVDIADAVLHR